MELLVIYKLKENSADEFMKALYDENIPQNVRRENGCLGYDYFISADKKDSVVLLEKWETKEAQAVHLSQPRMNRLREIKDKYVAETTVREL